MPTSSGSPSSTRSAAAWAASRERAYAYLLYPSAAALSEEAAQRLSTLSDYTELGSGFKIAMRDLEIRGAGNLLGADQSGHVAAVGFELYMGMLDEAVRLLSARLGRGGGRARAHGPPRGRVRAGRLRALRGGQDRAAPARGGAREIADLILLREELEDRFGPVPEPLDNLIKLQDARIKLGRAGARTVDFQGGRLAVAPIELDSRGARALREAVPEAVYESGRSTVRVRVPEEAAERFPAVVAAAEAILEVATAARTGGREAAIATLPHRAGHLDLRCSSRTAA